MYESRIEDADRPGDTAFELGVFIPPGLCLFKLMSANSVEGTVMVANGFLSGEEVVEGKSQKRQTIATRGKLAQKGMKREKRRLVRTLGE